MISATTVIKHDNLSTKNVSCKFLLSRFSLSPYSYFLFFYSRILLKKSGQRTPRIELDEIGPSLDLVMRRRKLASDDLFALARKQPKAAKVTDMQWSFLCRDICVDVL